RPPGAAPLLERSPRPFHQVAEWHRRRARRLTPAALDALLHVPLERGVDGRAVEVDRLHGGDPPPRRRRLEAGHPVRRAVREAQPACHARDELVLVEVEHATRGHARRAHRGAGVVVAAPGSRPGESLPVGSNAARIRSTMARFGSGTPYPSTPGAPASRSSQPPFAAATSRAAISPAGSAAATRTVPTPPSASQPRPAMPPSAGARSRSRLGRTEIRPRWDPSGHGGPPPAASGPVSGSRPADVASAATSSGCPSSSTRVVVPSHATHDGRNIRWRAANGSASLVNHRADARSGRTRSVPRTSPPIAPSEPTSRRGTSKPVTFLTVGPPPFTRRPSAVTNRTSSTRSRSGP